MNEQEDAKKILIEKAYLNFLEEIAKIGCDVEETHYTGLNFISCVLTVKL